MVLRPPAGEWRVDLQALVRRSWAASAAIVVLAATAAACTVSEPTRVKGVSLDAPSATTAAADAAQAVPPPGDAAITPPPETFDGPPPEQKAPPRVLASRVARSGGTWAVVVGVNDYPGSAYDLRSAVADADDLDAALKGMGVPDDHRLVLKDGQVTRKVLRTAAEWLVARAGPDAVAVFAFAGHVRKTGKTTEAMVAADGGTLTDAELAGIFRGLQARRAWTVVAACYGGGFTEVLRPGMVLTGASAADKEAYENLGFGRSYLVQYMVREAMIEGRAPDTVQSAFEYARGAISLKYPEREPVQFDQAGGPLDLRPPGSPRPTATTTTTTAPPPPPSSTTSTTAPPSSPPPTTTTTACRRTLAGKCLPG